MKYEDLIEKTLDKAHQDNQKFAKAMNELLISEQGEALELIIKNMISSYKDAHLFAEDDKERAVHKGSVLCLNALVAYIHSLAQSWVPPDPRGNVDLESQYKSSGFSVETGEDAIGTGGRYGSDQE